MKLFISLGTLLTAFLLLAACQPSDVQLREATATMPPIPATQVQESATPTTIPPTATVVKPTRTRQPSPYPLSEAGPYFAGKRQYTIMDASRDGREIDLTVWYPAIQEKDTEGRNIVEDAEVDMRDAPYPLIMTGDNSGDVIFRSHPATHGFVLVIVRHPDVYQYLDLQIYDHPLDFLYTIDQIAGGALVGLEDAVDTERIGVGGYSWHGAISLALSGVRINPDYFLNFCIEAAEDSAISQEFYIKYYCNLAKKWDAFADYVSEDVKMSENGLWQPMTDERVLAVMPMAFDGGRLYGEKGLAFADRPMLLISPTAEEYIPYEIEAVFDYENIGSPEHPMINFIGQGHMMVDKTDIQRKINHFATAFFGYHLQGREDYAYYYSEEFVGQFDDLSWGVYQGD